MKKIISLLTLSAMLTAQMSWAVAKIQNEDVKSLAQLTSAGGSASQLINDSKIYVTGNALNEQLSVAIANGDIGGSSGGSSGIELLGNPGFESGAITNGWSTSGGTAALVTSGTNLLFGKSTASWTASASNQTFSSTAYAVKGLNSGSCSASIYYTYAGTSGDYTLRALDGSSNVLSSQTLPAQSAATVPTVITFPCGSASTSTLQLQLISNVASPSIIYFDNAHLGSIAGATTVSLGAAPVTVQLSGSGTYTVPTSPALSYMEVYAVGGGGGGGGGGSSGTITGAGAGGTTTFGSVASVTGGSPGVYDSSGGVGGVPTLTAPAAAVKTFTGGSGGGVADSSASFRQGGTGGTNPFGGGGGGGAATLNGQAAASFTGGGGGGGANAAASGNNPGAGGGAGGYAHFTIPGSALASTYTYSVGAGGIAGLGGTSNGGAGGTGTIILRLYYGNTAASIVTALNSAQSWSGYEYFTGGGWSTTNTGAYADMTAATTITLIQATNSNMGTVTYPASLLPGITFTPARTGSVYVCASAVTSFSTSSSAVYLRLVDTNGNIVNAGTAITPVAGAFNQFSLCGISNVTAATTLTYKIQATLSASGTAYISQLAQAPLSWSLIPLSGNYPSPNLVGSVTSSSTNTLEHLERATTGGSSTQCTSSPCTLASNTAGISSIARNSAGDYTANFAANTFSAAPTCVCIASNGTNGNLNYCSGSYSAGSSTSFNFRTYYTTTGSINDSGFSLICMGPR